MSGFEDDFGELVEPSPAQEDVLDLLEPTIEVGGEDCLLLEEEEEVKETDITIEAVPGKTA